MFPNELQSPPSPNAEHGCCRAYASSIILQLRHCGRPRRRRKLPPCSTPLCRRPTPVLNEATSCKAHGDRLDSNEHGEIWHRESDNRHGGFRLEGNGRCASRISERCSNDLRHHAGRGSEWPDEVHGELDLSIGNQESLSTLR